MDMSMHSMKSTLHIGDIGEYLADYAFTWSGQSRLIDSGNLNEFGAGNYHTSLGDLSAEQIIQLALDADEVVYLQPMTWSSSQARLATESIVNYISHRKKVVNWFRPYLDDQDELEYPTVDAGVQPRLWVFGDEHSHGTGLAEIKKEAYAYRLADQLNYQLVNVSRPGTSTRWSLKHLINANIGPKDIVIWQPSSLGRLTVVNADIKQGYLAQLSEEYLESYNNILITHNSVETHLKDLPNEYLRVYNDAQLLADHLTLINIGIRYCETNNIQLLMTTVDRDQASAVRSYVSRYPQWLWTAVEFEDQGLDNTHAGPKTHARLAQDLYTHAQFLGYV